MDSFLKCSDVHNSCWACATDKSLSNLCSLFDTVFEMNADDDNSRTLFDGHLYSTVC